MSYYLNEIIELEKSVAGKNLSNIKLISLGYIYAMTSCGLWKNGEVVIGANEEKLKGIVNEIKSYLDVNK